MINIIRALSSQLFRGKRVIMMIHSFQHKFIPAAAALEPFGNAGDGGGGKAGFSDYAVIRYFFVKHLSGLPAVAEFFQFAWS